MSPNGGDLIDTGRIAAEMDESREQQRRDEERSAARWLSGLFHSNDAGAVFYVRESGQVIRLTSENSERWLREVNTRRDRMLGAGFRFKLPTAESMTEAHKPGAAALRKARRTQEKGRALGTLLGLMSHIPYLPR